MAFSLSRLTVAAVAIVVLPSIVWAANPELPDEVLILSPVGGAGGRNPLPIDSLATVLAGEWKTPKAGDKFTDAAGRERKWTASPFTDGKIGLSPGSHGYLAVTSPREQVLILQASGHSMVFVNGEPRVGDVYGNGYVRVPVLLHEGVNHFLFASGRGPVTVKFLEPKATAELDGGDLTLPDLPTGVAVDAVAAVPVRNCTKEPATGLVLETAVGDGEPATTPVPALLPASLRKVKFQLKGPAPANAWPIPVRVRLLQKDKVLDTLELKLNAVSPASKQKRTFISAIDGSVQYYVLVPAKPTDDDKKPGLVLSLHGAQVEATSQAGCYAPKPGLHVVAATNRRPFGFDWEDWGRLDALEVLDHAARTLGTDPRRTYLTGHSMGGHGTWHLGVTYPDRFAAIAPSAGWVSMWSYGGMPKDSAARPERELVLRASGPSDTLALEHNLAHVGVYILHGDRDDNVPVEQARTMRKELAAFHSDFAYYERPGAGHWWGDACVDWPPIFDFFSRHELPERRAVRAIDFRTANPCVSPECHWLRIEAQEKAFLISQVEIACDPEKRSFRGTTQNVARLSLDLTPLEAGKPFRVELDRQVLADLPWPKDETRAWFARDGDKWAAVPRPSPGVKSPERCGAFKEAFRNRMVFVYGTRGSTADNAWALAKARYDAESFWYRGNGSIDVVADIAFDPAADPDRNVVLYGHAGTNAAWKALLGESPVQVTEGKVQVGDRDVSANDCGVLLVRPRPGSDRAIVAAVAGTGAVGRRLTDRLPYFVSGVGYPDWVVFDLKGIVGAGYFGNDWKLTGGESAWRKD